MDRRHIKKKSDIASFGYKKSRTYCAENDSQGSTQNKDNEDKHKIQRTNHGMVPKLTFF